MGWIILGGIVLFIAFWIWVAGKADQEEQRREWRVIYPDEGFTVRMTHEDAVTYRAIFGGSIHRDPYKEWYGEKSTDPRFQKQPYE